MSRGLHGTHTSAGERETGVRLYLGGQNKLLMMRRRTITATALCWLSPTLHIRPPSYQLCYDFLYARLFVTIFKCVRMASFCLRWDFKKILNFCKLNKTRIPYNVFGNLNLKTLYIDSYSGENIFDRISRLIILNACDSHKE